LKHADGGERTLDILQNYFKLETITIGNESFVSKIQATYKVSKTYMKWQMHPTAAIRRKRKKLLLCFLWYWTTHP
jgi:hypothetical protein